MHLLPKNKYHLASNALERVSFNKLFARAVCENHVSGEIFVNKLENPTCFYIIHPYGMTFLIHDSKHPQFDLQTMDWLLNRNKSMESRELLQVYPPELEQFVDAYLDDSYSAVPVRKAQKELIDVEHPLKLKKLTRINFKFNSIVYKQIAKINLNNDIALVQTTRELYEQMEGSVVPKGFWNNGDDFLQKGGGFSLLCNGELAATAFASFRMDNYLELGMETLPKFRNRGFGTMVCMKLIDYCLKNDLEPVWACSQSNGASLQLALKLGFEPVKYLPFYELTKN